MWRCNHKYNNDKKCKTPHIYEEKLKELFIKAVNELTKNKEEIVIEYKEMIKTLDDTSKLEEERDNLTNEAEKMVKLIKDHVEVNSHIELNQEEYEKRYNELLDEYEEIRSKLEKVEEDIFSKKVKYNNIKQFIERLEEQKEIITQFDEEVWISLIERVKISIDKEIVFIFKNNEMIKYKIDKKD